MSLRTSLKKLIRPTPSTSLRERTAELRASLASPSRRAVVAGSLVAAAPLPALASGEAVSPKEAAFLALIPEALLLLRQYIPAQAAWQAIADAADAAAGPFPAPGYSQEQHTAWHARVAAARSARGYGAARKFCHPIETALDALVDGYDQAPMRTLPAILFKAALDPLHDGWSQGAIADLERLAAERFDLPVPIAEDAA